MSSNKASNIQTGITPDGSKPLDIEFDMNSGAVRGSKVEGRRWKVQGGSMEVEGGAEVEGGKWKVEGGIRKYGGGRQGGGKLKVEAGIM